MPVAVRDPGRAYQDAAARLGRPLTAAELRVDVVQADRDLGEAKRRLAAAIESEKRRVVRARLDGRRQRVTPTRRMLYAIFHAYDAGRRHARTELHHAGVHVPGRRLYHAAGDVRAYEERKVPARIAALAQERLQRRLREDVQRRVDVEMSGAVVADFGGLSAATIARRLAARIPGPLDAASYLVTPAFDAGLTDVFETVKDVIQQWQQTAIMDNATCQPCADADGTVYDSWDDAMEAMPDGGPFPDCDGDTRCRCRLVPVVD